MLDDGEHLASSSGEYRKAEAELASRSFRFPDRIARLVKTAQEALSEYGQLVNEGLFDRADLQLAKFRDDYSAITRIARGWRLADPFEGIRKKFKRREVDEKTSSDFDLS